MLWLITKGRRRSLPSLQAVRLKLNQREPDLGENFLTAVQGQSAWPASLGSCLGCPSPSEKVRFAKCLVVLLTIALTQVTQGLLHDLRFFLDSRGRTAGADLLLESVQALGYARPTLSPVCACSALSLCSELWLLLGGIVAICF